jgi:hypothetical protein
MKSFGDAKQRIGARRTMVLGFRARQDVTTRNRAAYGETAARVLSVAMLDGGAMVRLSSFRHRRSSGSVADDRYDGYEHRRVIPGHH